MPLIDIQLAVSGLDSRTLEQAGIIANFFAGFLLASDYLLFNDKISETAAAHPRRKRRGIRGAAA